MLTTDKNYRWQGYGDGFGNRHSHCRIRIFHAHPESVVVVVSDQGNDTGTSITNCVGQLATLAKIAQRAKNVQVHFKPLLVKSFID